jgi:hypothetical protein
MSLDVLLREVHEKIEGVCSTKGKPEGSMAEGYIVYKSFYYVNEYIKKISNTEGEVVGDDHQDEDKREGELLQTNEKRHLIKSKSVIFCQFSIEKLFTLKLIIYFSSYAICFEFFYTSANLEILMPSINSFFEFIIYI